MIVPVKNPSRARSRLEAGREDPARGGRGRRPAGARGRRAARPPRCADGPCPPGRRPRTTRRCRSGRRAAGGGQLLGCRRVGLAALGRLELGGAGLARHLHARDRRARAGAAADDGEHEPLDGARDPRASWPARSPASRRAASKSNVGCGRGRAGRSSPRRSPSAAPSPARGPGRSPTSRPRGRRRSPRPAGSCSSPRPAMPGSRLKPKRSATSTRRLAPSCAPSGANTELHDSAKDSTSVPPHDSPLALSRSTPSSVAFVCDGIRAAAGSSAPPRARPSR